MRAMPRTPASHTRRFVSATLVTLAAAYLLAAQAPARSREADVDRIFAKWTSATPGCAVGVGVNGKSVLEKAYGMSDLEHDVRSAPDSIYEAGSVSKQFTAAAVLLLAKQGKLSLDDPVQKYVPELPAYPTPLLIRHMLNHTSGLRDWGEIEAIAGWPRTTRAYTHAHVVDILSRQRALNFPSGTQWSYSNSGYNLAAVIVSRVSGTSFADFSQERIFKPLGMTHTSWRDDFTRVVKNRAIAYADGRDGTFRMDMPFENVHGNGGLLTTVGDLLKWNQNFAEPKVGDAAFVREQQEPGHFNDGRAHEYALGLFVARYKGVREINHSGATAGYRAYLARYPDQGVSVAVLCNVSSGNATQYAHAVADLYLADAPKAVTTTSSVATPDAPAEPPAPRPRPAADYHPSAKDLEAFTGRYSSDEAETTLTVAVEDGDLVVKRRPDTIIKLRPTAVDTFAAPTLGTIKFIRSGGRVEELSVVMGRVFDMRFRRN